MAGTLYLVSTPIGNLEDITLRALKILKNVSLIACEDTRQTNKLLQHYQINCPTISYHEHNERERSQYLLNKLNFGESIALVSDAGTPVISDPGFVLVQKAIEAQISVVSIPGPSALLPALIGSGLPCHEFLFIGFLPSKQSQRRKKLEEIKSLPYTIICYESPHRISASLTDAKEIFGTRKIVIARELTKLHEEFLRGTLSDLSNHILEHPLKGELVLIMAPADQTTEIPNLEKSLSLMIEDQIANNNLDKMAALKAVARSLGISKSEAYRRLQMEEKK
jgi:16S rRNA (cytidine1402-2'-O)-methyltransferase